MKNTIFIPNNLTEKADVILSDSEVSITNSYPIPRRQKNKKGFTLAETMIVIIVLGVIAIITIPALLNKSTDTQNRTKIKKALSMYEKLVENIRLEKNFTDVDTMATWAKGDNDTCSNAKAFFKIKEDLGNCKFTTNDGLYWDISNLKETVVSTAKDDTCRASVNAEQDDECYNKTFKFTVTNSDDGKFFVVNKSDGDACNALVYVKIVESDSCPEPYLTFNQKLEKNFDSYINGKQSLKQMINKMYPDATITTYGNCEGLSYFNFSEFVDNALMPPAYAYYIDAKCTYYVKYNGQSVMTIGCAENDNSTCGIGGYVDLNDDGSIGTSHDCIDPQSNRECKNLSSGNEGIWYVNGIYPYNPQQ